MTTFDSFFNYNIIGYTWCAFKFNLQPYTNIPQVTSSVSVVSTTSPVPMFPRCIRKAEEFVKMRECSAGLDLRSTHIFGQPASSCELQLLYSRFCKSQKCLNRFVELVYICLNETGLNISDISEVI